MKSLAPILFSVLISSLAQADTASGGGRAVISAGSRTSTIGSGFKSAGSSIKVFKYRDKKGIASFSDAAPADAAYEVLTYGCFACNVNSSVDWYTTRLHADFGDHIRVASEVYAVDPALVRAVIHAESGFNPMARSGKGAVGLMQLMPGTARDMGVSNSYEAGQNIMGGARYLSYLLGELKGDVQLATAAYNAGLANVTKYQGIPPFAETQAYVKRVGILYQRYKSQNLAKL
ncbi:MAG TPA: lytic transglycosylase domain-containing protein [Cellvibrionaceae bacterium]